MIQNAEGQNAEKWTAEQRQFVMRLIRGAATYLGGMLFISFFKAQVLVICLFLAAMIALVVSRPTFTRQERLILLLGATFGPLAEIIAVHFGVWSYSHATVIGIPLWLPLLWGLASVFFLKIERALSTLMTS